MEKGHEDRKKEVLRILKEKMNAPPTDSKSSGGIRKSIRKKAIKVKRAIRKVVKKVAKKRAAKKAVKKRISKPKTKKTKPKTSKKQIKKVSKKTAKPAKKQIKKSVKKSAKKQSKKTSKKQVKKTVKKRIETKSVKKKVSSKKNTPKKIIRKKSSRMKRAFKKLAKKLAKKKKEKKKEYKSIMTKSKKNPIISPNSANGWEAWQTFNPAAILIDDKVHLLYRAIGHDAVSRLGYASTIDGHEISERHPDPVYEHSTSGAGKYVVYSVASGGSWGGCEDPRIMEVEGDDNLYITYTACDGGLRVGLSSIKKKDFKNKKWIWTPPQLISPKGQVHKNWVIFPEKINGKYAILHSVSPKISIEYLDSLNLKGKTIKSHYHPGKHSRDRWDSFVRGPGPPPIKTKHGWLLLYHAMDQKDMSKYLLGAMLLDLKDPTKVLYRSKEPILVPDECYEMEGFKAGVVYALGAVVRDGELIVYYGGADSHVCVAHLELEKLLDGLVKKKKKLPKLKFFKKGKKIKL